MRYQDMRPAEIEDRRPLGQRFTLMPIGGYTDATGAGPVQQLVNQRAQGLGADLPMMPADPASVVSRNEYRPRGMGAPERPPAFPPGWNPDPDYRQGGPENQQQQIEYLRSLYAR